MPKIFNINPDGTLGDEVESCVCWGFLGRLDDFEPEDSHAWCCIQETEGHTLAARADVSSEYDVSALGYLTWLMEHSPYRDVFVSTGYEAVQQGFAVVNFDTCNQAVILGLSHLRRSTVWLHNTWNALPEHIPGGLKYLICLVLHPERCSKDGCFGAGQGDNTSTVLKYFDAQAWHAWLEDKQIPEEDTYIEAGGYHTDFCNKYYDSMRAEDSDTCLRDMLDGIQDMGYEVHRVKGLFYDREIAVLSCEPIEVLEFIRTKLEGTDYCINKYLGVQDADVLPRAS